MGAVSLRYEKYLAANITIPVYWQKRSRGAENALCGYDARHEPDLHFTVPDRADHYADKADKTMNDVQMCGYANVQMNECEVLNLHIFIFTHLHI